MPSWKKTFQKELLSVKALLYIFLIAAIYMIVTVLLLNYRLVYQVFAGSFPLLFKLTLLTNLIGGLWTIMSPVDFFLLIGTAFLVGVNLYLILRTISVLEDSKIKVSVGGATIIGLVTTGCASCGFSLLSILGLSATFSFLPFHGLELHLLAIILLIISFFYMFRQIHLSKYCRITKKK